MHDLLKRGMDLLFGTALLAALAVIMAIVAVIVKFTSKGPIIYKHRRLGRGGREFNCFKFRTMVVNADAILQSSPELRAEFERNFKLVNDPRLTRCGAFLRKTSLDELPQLVNVLRGELSLIGPRPIVPREIHKYGEHAAELLTVKPGLGGIWQAYGRSNTSYAERVAMDLRYIQNRSILLDLKLLVMTAISVIKRDGAV